MEIRIILAVCVVAGSSLCGRSMASAVRRRVALLQALVKGIKNLRVHMVSMYEPVQSALNQSECPVLQQTGARMQAGASAAEAWKEVAGDGGKALSMDALTAGDRRVLDGFFEHLGESGREEQTLLLDSTARELSELYEDARQSASESERLYTKLGVLIGLMLALIVI